MNNDKHSEIQLVITFALKKEIPKEWLESRNVPVHTLAAVRSGALKNSNPGMFVLITGAGLKASEEAACWIRDNLKTLFVLNIGTCGVTDKRRSTGRWLRPQYVSNEDGDILELDDRLPVPFPENAINIKSLISVKKPMADTLPDTWKKHDAIDMECHAQAKVFQDTDITLHCLKFSTDHCDHNTNADFQKNLELFTEEIKKLFTSTIPPFTSRYDSIPRGDTGGYTEGANITAIIPVHNRAQTIQRAIDSILSQTLPPKEIIVVDDASTDGTKEILKNYGSRITPVFLPKNSGVSRARNEGIKHAKTEWIAFLDSDDQWERDKLKNQVEYIRKYPFYQIMQSDEQWIRNGKRVNSCKHHQKPFGWIWEPSLERCLVSTLSVLIKKSLLEKYGCFDESLEVCEDYDLWIKISRYHPVGLDPVLSVIKYGGHKDQLSFKYPAMDSFRVRSLYNLLHNEPLSEYRQKMIKVLKKKLNILITGYRKRERIADALKCEKILGTLYF